MFNCTTVTWKSNNLHSSNFHGWRLKIVMSYFIVIVIMLDQWPCSYYVPLIHPTKHECGLVVRVCVPWSLALFLLPCICHLQYRLQVTNAAQVGLRTRLIKFSLTHTNTSWTICCIPWHQVTTKPLMYDNACVQLRETYYVVHLEKRCWMSACMYSAPEQESQLCRF